MASDKTTKELITLLAWSYKRGFDDCAKTIKMITENNVLSIEKIEQLFTEHFEKAKKTESPLDIIKNKSIH